jgi:alkylmercury lyase
MRAICREQYEQLTDDKTQGGHAMSASVFASMKTALVEPETSFEWKVIHRFWQMLVESTTPISLDALAQALHSSRERVKAVLEPEAEYDQFGNLVGWGLTQNPTIHQVVLEGHSLYAWCAPDTLYHPVVVNRPAQVVSQCPVTGARIELMLTPDRLESLSPEAAVVSIARDWSIFQRLKEAGCIRQGGCNSQFFFASGEVAAPWVSEHADFIVLPVEEAFLGLRDVALQQMALVARA